MKKGTAEKKRNKKMYQTTLYQEFTVLQNVFIQFILL